MRVRQLRKRKPVPPLAELQILIHRRLLRAARRWPLRNDVAGRGVVSRAVERGWFEYTQRHGLRMQARKVTPA